LTVVDAALAFVAVRWLLPYALAILGVLVFWVASRQGVAQEAAMGGKVVGSCMGLLGAGWLVDRWHK
jgi:hypothetical protein